MPALPLGLKAFLGKFGPYIAVAAMVVAVLTLAYCNGRSAGASREVNNELERTNEVQRQVGEANEVAGKARLEDRLTITQQKKELDDAIATGEDADTLRRRRGCLILRQQGRDTAGNPACRGFEAVN